MTPADRYRLVSSQFDRLVAEVPADAWDAPSPCEGWSARQVLQHVVDTEADLLGRMGAGTPDVSGVDPIEGWHRVRDAMSAALADPAVAGHEYDGYFGRTTFERTVDDFYSFDLVVHRWDIAHATGLPDHEVIDDDELARLRRGAEGFGDAMRMPGVFGPEVPAPSDATPQERFLAWIGRDPRS